MLDAEVLRDLALELGRFEAALDLLRAHLSGVRALRHAGLHPAPKAHDRLLHHFGSRVLGSLFTVPQVVLLGVEELDGGVEAVRALGGELRGHVPLDREVGHGVGVVDHLQRDLRTILFCLPEEGAALALVVVELELAAIALVPLGSGGGEHVDGEAVDGHTRRAVGDHPRRAELGVSLDQIVVKEDSAPRVVAQRAIRVVRFEVEDGHRLSTWTHRVAALLDELPYITPLLTRVAVDLGRVALALQLDAQIFYGIGRGGGTLTADGCIYDLEVIGAAVGAAKNELLDLVARLGVRAFTPKLLKAPPLEGDTKQRLAALVELVPGGLTRVGAQHIVTIAQRLHLLIGGAVGDVVVQHLVVSEGGRVDAQAAQLDVRGGAVKDDALRRALAEHRVLIGIRLREHPIDVAADGLLLAGGVDDQRDAVVLARIKGRLQAKLTRDLLTLLAAEADAATRGHLDFLGGDDEAAEVPRLMRRGVVAADDSALVAAHIAQAQLHREGDPPDLSIRGKGLVANARLGAIEELQRLARPARATPVDALKRGAHAAARPLRGLSLDIATPSGEQLKDRPLLDAYALESAR